MSSTQNLTDSGGLVLLRRLWDRLGLGVLLDRRATDLPGHYRPSLMVEVWTALLFYGGGVLDDLPLLQHRGVRRIFGWVRVPDPTMFGRWLRRCGAALVPVLDEANWAVVRWRWKMAGVPRALTLLLDSTVSARYGEKQAGAEAGFNPRNPYLPGHRSHAPPGENGGTEGQTTARSQGVHRRHLEVCQSHAEATARLQALGHDVVLDPFPARED